MHSLGDVWHLGSEDLESLSGFLLCRIWRIWSLWGPVSLAALFLLPIFMHSFGDVWHLGSEDLESLQVLGPCYLSAFLRSVSGALGGPQCHLLQGSGVSAGSGSPALQDLEDLESLGPSVTCCTLSSYLYAFLRAVSGALGGPQCHLLQGSGVSAGSGSLLCRIWRIWSLWGPVSLAALFLPIFMHSLGQSLGPLGVHRIWRIWSLWGPVSLAALFLPISLCIP